MEAITNMLQVNFSSTILSVMTILVGYVSIVKILEQVKKATGFEFEGMRKKREDHELLINTAKGLIELKTQRSVDVEESIKHDEAIRKDLSELKEMFIDREIDTMRLEIINFAIKISEGKPCNQDGYRHCLKTFTKYEKLLEQYKMTNGEVTLSMDIINESYKEKLKNGF